MGSCTEVTKVHRKWLGSYKETFSLPRIRLSHESASWDYTSSPGLSLMTKLVNLNPTLNNRSSWLIMKWYNCQAGTNHILGSGDAWKGWRGHFISWMTQDSTLMTTSLTSVMVTSLPSSWCRPKPISCQSLTLHHHRQILAPIRNSRDKLGPDHWAISEC